jgi:hypothetical protein
MDEYVAIFGYSHLLGGFAGGQAEYVRVPLVSSRFLTMFRMRKVDIIQSCQPFESDLGSIRMQHCTFLISYVRHITQSR